MYPGIADTLCPTVIGRFGPEAEMMPAALFSHTAPWMSLAPSITGPLYLKLLFLRLRKKL